MSAPRVRARRARLGSRVNLARFNHILIPSTKEGRDRLRRSLLGRALRPLVHVYEALSAEGAVFAGASLAAAIFGLDVRATQTHELWAALAALLAASLLVAQLYRMGGLRLQVSAPRRVFAGDELVFAIQLANGAPRELQAIRLMGPFLPWDGRWTSARRALRSVAPGASARIEMRARFSERGEHHIDAFRAAALVPFGLALGPSVYSAGCRFLVVPRLARVVRVTLPAATRYQPGGVALASKTGESLDLLGVRPYRPGDPVRDLHARSWAKLGAPVVREFQQEYFTRVALVLDSDLGSGELQALEAAISLAAGIAAELLRGEALVDLWISGPEPRPLTLGRSVGSLEQGLDRLACVRPADGFCPEALLERLGPQLGRLSCLVLVALRWDEERAGLQSRVRAAGADAISIALGEPLETGEPVRWQSAAAILRGDAIAL